MCLLPRQKEAENKVEGRILSETALVAVNRRFNKAVSSYFSPQLFVFSFYFLAVTRTTGNKSLNPYCKSVSPQVVSPQLKVVSPQRKSRYAPTLKSFRLKQFVMYLQLLEK